MRLKERVRPLIVTACATVALIIGVAAAADAKSFSDIRTNWAKDDIVSLVEQGVIKGYPDGTFRPNQAVTRAEFAKMMAKAFNLKPHAGVGFRDTAGHWAAPYVSGLAGSGITKGYPDGRFRPNKTISRAEVVTMLMRAVDVTPPVEMQKTDRDNRTNSKVSDAASAKANEPVFGKSWPESFTDVGHDHWAFASIEAANRLGVLPPFLTTKFRPTYAATRAETAAMIASTARLQVAKGTVDAIDATSGTATVRRTDGSITQVAFALGSIVTRNSVPSAAENLLAGDEITVISNRYGEAQFARAYGLVTKTDLLGKVSELTKGTLTPGQIAAIATGDWAAASAGLSGELFNRLTEIGVGPTEADAILRKDWASLEGLAKQQLAAALSKQTNISADLASSVLAGNWEAAKSYAQVEAVQRVLGSLMF